MLNDRDEEHYEHEESEYHFSDDDVSYEVEAEASKPAAPESTSASPVKGLSQSRRMIISLVVFLGLIFVVYKMVSPGGTGAPSTDISPVVTQAMPAIAPPPLPHTTDTAAAQPAASTPSQMNATAQTPPVPPTPNATVVAQQPTQAVAPPAPVTPAPTPAQAAPTPAPTQAAATTVTTTTTATPVAQAPAMAPAPAMPAAPATTTVVTTTSAPTAPAAQAQQPMPVATTVTSLPPATMPANNTDAAIAAMAATNEKLMNQLQAQYSQKVADYSNQTRMLQDQMQTLNSRVAGLESQLGQLVQTLTRQTNMGGGSSSSLNVVPTQQPPAPIVEPKVSYNVQAIIPGRAWLKSDNGETLTVAEGDSIKELGRVTKIDPYDGVVEVNTGNKTVSISYGNGG